MHEASLALLSVVSDAAQRPLLRKWASSLGWYIEFAHDAASGIAAAKMCQHDVILLDIDLPGGVSGVDVKAILDDEENLSNKPVIGITSMTQKEVVECALQAGFASYLAKPIDLMALERVIKKVVHEKNEA